jgi:hypothetical protein
MGVSGLIPVVMQRISFHDQITINSSFTSFFFFLSFTLYNMAYSNLRIMQVPYQKGMKQDDSLMSPPLTPTDTFHPPHATLSPTLWDYPTKNRKQFIESYSRMVPSLRKTNCIDTNERTFALNVYRDLLITKKQQEQEDKIKDCAMLDNVVPHTKKRKLAITALKDKQAAPPQKRKRVSSVLPSGKDAALAFDAIDIDTSDQDFYPEGWVPRKEALDQVPVKVSWKGKFKKKKCNQSIRTNIFFFYRRSSFS